jgi:hypothetical protein
VAIIVNAFQRVKQSCYLLLIIKGDSNDFAKSAVLEQKTRT